MVAEFYINGKKTVGDTDVAALFECVVAKVAYASKIKVVMGNETATFDTETEDYNFDISKGSVFYEACVETNFNKKKVVTSLSLGDVVTVELSEEVEDKCNISFRLAMDIKDFNACFYAGDNDFIAALLGKRTLGKLTCRTENFGFGNAPMFPEEVVDALRVDVEPVTDGEKLRLVINDLTGGEEIVIENDGKPVIRVATKESNFEKTTNYGVCNERGGISASKCFKGVVSLRYDDVTCENYTVVPLVKEVKRGKTLFKCDGASVIGEPTRRFAAIRYGNRIALYESGDSFPRLIRSVECDGEFALCSDGALITMNSGGVELYLPDGRNLNLNIAKGDSVVIVSEENKYHFAIKNGRFLLRFELNKESGECRLISAIMGKNIGLFRNSEDTLGYRDGDVVAIVDTESYREFDYPFAGDPDDFGFVCDCKNFSAAGKSGNYKEKTSFDLNCDFVGCDGLACADGKLYMLGRELVPLADGITSAAVIGDYVIAAENDCVALYYAAFQGVFVFCDEIAGKAFVFTYFEGVNPLTDPTNVTVSYSFAEEKDFET